MIDREKGFLYDTANGNTFANPISIPYTKFESKSQKKLPGKELFFLWFFIPLMELKHV